MDANKSVWDKESVMGRFSIQELRKAKEIIKHFEPIVKISQSTAERNNIHLTPTATVDFLYDSIDAGIDLLQDAYK
jgi:hypothetical protein